MITVKFLGPFNKESLEVSLEKINTVEDLAQELKKDDSISSELLDLSAIAINDELILDKKHQLNKNDVVSILPPVCGG